MALLWLGCGQAGHVEPPVATRAPGHTQTRAASALRPSSGADGQAAEAGSQAAEAGSQAAEAGSQAAEAGSQAAELGVAVAAGGRALSWPALPGTSEIRIFLASEPAPSEGSALPDAKRVATLGGDEEGHLLRQLAPAVDAFVRVEADTPEGLRSQDLHLRAAPGPGGPVRGVSAVGPKTLMVTLRNGNGRVWARRGWAVRRRDGRSVAVVDVHRHSVPVGQPGYEIGFGADDDLARVEVDHRVFLRLAEPLGQRDVFEIRGPNDVRIVVPFSDCFLETPAIQLNQVGMSPRARVRYAYVSMWMGDGGGLPLGDYPQEAELRRDLDDALGGRPLVRGGLAIADRSPNDEDAGSEVREIDLSSMPADGEAVYRIRIPGVGVSHPTRISEAAVFEAYYVIARGLFHNRWGGDLAEQFTDHPRGPDHRHVYVREHDNPFGFHPRDTQPGGARLELRGGYHDAGDFDQRPMHTVVPQVLMRAYERAPEVFPDSQLTIPESGNRRPDLLDEALWGVEAWRALQTRNGGVRAGVESTRHPWGIYPADADELHYYTYSADPQVTMRAAGLFAQAARLVRPHEPGQSLELARRAQRAYRWAASHGAQDVYRLYGAGELYRLTGDARYKLDFEQAWGRIGPYGAFSRFIDRHAFQGDYARQGQVMPDYILGYLLADDPSPRIVEQSREWLGRKANEVAANILRSTHAHRNARPRGRPVAWGQGTVMGRYLDPIVARLALGELSDSDRQRYFDAMSIAADYVLGANPLGMSFVTGLGAVSPREPLHLDSLVYVKRGAGPMPGIPVYGPVEQLPRADYYRFGRSAFHPPFEAHPLMRRYADIRSFVVTNECTIWECQAPHAAHFAMLVEANRAPEPRLLPEGARRGRPDRGRSR